MILDVGPNMEHHLQHVRKSLFLLAQSKVRAQSVAGGSCGTCSSWWGSLPACKRSLSAVTMCVPACQRS